MAAGEAAVSGVVDVADTSEAATLRTEPPWEILDPADAPRR